MFFTHVPMVFIPYVFAPHWPKWVPSGQRHRALRNCSRQASRLPKGPGAAKAACSWPEGVCKVWTNLGGLFQGTKKNWSSWWLNQHHWKIWVKLGIFPNFRGEHEKCLKPPPSWWFRDPAFSSWYVKLVNIPIIYRVLYGFYTSQVVKSNIDTLLKF